MELEKHNIVSTLSIKYVNQWELLISQDNLSCASTEQNWLPKPSFRSSVVFIVFNESHLHSGLFINLSIRFLWVKLQSVGIKLQMCPLPGLQEGVAQLGYFTLHNTVSLTIWNSYCTIQCTLTAYTNKTALLRVIHSHKTCENNS